MNLADAYVEFYNTTILPIEWRMVIELKGKHPIRDVISVIRTECNNLTEDLNFSLNMSTDASSNRENISSHCSIRLHTQKVHEFLDIATSSIEGQLLIAAIGILSSSVYKDLTPNQILSELNKIAGTFDITSTGGEDNGIEEW